MTKWLAVVAALGCIAVGCSGDGGGGSDGRTAADGVRIAAFDFAESDVLAELYAQALELEEVPVVRLGRVGPREIVAPALQLGLVDLVPEYLGTASAYFGAAEPELDALRQAVAPMGIRPLSPAPAQDTNVFVVTRETAERHDLAKLSDLEGIAHELGFGGTVECPERPLCLLGLERTYGLRFESFVPQRSLAVTAEALRRGEIDVGLMFSTSADLDPDSFVVLTDDRALQPPENVVPLVRTDALRRWGGGVADALDRVSALLTTEDLRGLNERVDAGEPPEVAAREWLERRNITN